MKIRNEVWLITFKTVDVFTLNNESKERKPRRSRKIWKIGEKKERE